MRNTKIYDEDVPCSKKCYVKYKQRICMYIILQRWEDFASTLLGFDNWVYEINWQQINKIKYIEMY